MCYIFVKRSDQYLDPDLVVGARHLGNRDGAGVMYAEDDRVKIEKILPARTSKGDDEVREFFESHMHRACAFHLRNQSLGPVNLENAHPYWVTNKDWGHPYDIAMMHNGTVSGVQINTDLSDTGNIATYILRPLFAKNKTLTKMLFTSEEYWFQLSCWTGTNKFVLLNNEGTFVIVNPNAGRNLDGSGVWVSGKNPLKPISPEGKDGTYNQVTVVHSTPANKGALLRPENVSWEVEPDGKFHIRISQPNQDDYTEVSEIMARIEEQSHERMLNA